MQATRCCAHQVAVETAGLIGDILHVTEPEPDADASPAAASASRAIGGSVRHALHRSRDDGGAADGTMLQLSAESLELGSVVSNRGGLANPCLGVLGGLEQASDQWSVLLREACDSVRIRYVGRNHGQRLGDRAIGPS